MNDRNYERIHICEECDHIFTEEDKQINDESKEWGHPCKSRPRSKKLWRCESFLQPFVPDEARKSQK